MNGVAFNIGSIPIYWYGILVVAGMMAACAFSYIEWKSRGNDRVVFWWMFWVVVISGYFGSRWFYLIFNPSDIQSWFSFISISSGRSIIGGVLFSTLISSLAISIFKIPVDKRELYSIVLPNMLLAQSIGRWGNFTNQELYGSMVDNLDWAPNFIKEGMTIEAEGATSMYQPLFVYESFLDFTGWLMITFIFKQMKYFKIGTHGSMYFIWYGIVRASMELLRDDKFIMKINGFPTSFFWALIFIIFGIASFIVFQWYYDKWNYFVNEKVPNFLSMTKEKTSMFFKCLINKEISYYINRLEIENIYLEKKVLSSSRKIFYVNKFQGDCYKRN